MKDDVSVAERPATIQASDGRRRSRLTRSIAIIVGMLIALAVLVVISAAAARSRSRRRRCWAVWPTTGISTSGRCRRTRMARKPCGTCGSRGSCSG